MVSSTMVDFIRNIQPLRMRVNNKKEHIALKRSYKIHMYVLPRFSQPHPRVSGASLSSLFTALHDTQHLTTDLMSASIPGHHMRLRAMAVILTTPPWSLRKSLRIRDLNFAGTTTCCGQSGNGKIEPKDGGQGVIKVNWRPYRRWWKRFNLKISDKPYFSTCAYFHSAGVTVHRSSGNWTLSTICIPLGNHWPNAISRDISCETQRQSRVVGARTWSELSMPLMALKSFGPRPSSSFLQQAIQWAEPRGGTGKETAIVIY